MATISTFEVLSSCSVEDETGDFYWNKHKTLATRAAEVEPENGMWNRIHRHYFFTIEKQDSAFGVQVVLSFNADLHWDDIMDGNNYHTSQNLTLILPNDAITINDSTSATLPKTGIYATVYPNNNVKLNGRLRPKYNRISNGSFCFGDVSFNDEFFTIYDYND